MEKTFRHNIITLEKLSALIKKESGLHFPPNYLNVLDQRIAVTLRQKKCTEQELVDLLYADKKELEEFIAHVTTNFTQFFRSIEQFHMLGELLLPLIVEDEEVKNKHIKIWSAACSSGEEPYTLALYVDEFLEKNNLRDWTFSILASDISNIELEKAKTGVYPYEALKNIPEIYRKHLDITEGTEYAPGLTDGGSIIVSERLKSLVTFQYHNLINPAPEKDFDIIFCRNVLIYFDLETQKNVVDYLQQALKPDRYLVISPSESLSAIETTLQAYVLPAAVFYKNRK